MLLVDPCGLTDVSKQMHQTTIRFDGELWRRIEAESARIGVSAAQYIRDSTLVRLTQETSAHTPVPRLHAEAAAAIDVASTANLEAQAVWAQARLARDRAKALREAAGRLTEVRAPRPWAGMAAVERQERQERGSGHEFNA